jgi:deoxyadenosine/deoxycytidine kinase
MATQTVKPALVVLFEGVIAAGKTEMVRALVAEINRRRDVARAQGALSAPSAVAIFEPVPKWEQVGILADFYADPRRYGYSFQTYVYITQIQEIQEAVARVDPAEVANTVFVLERSPISDEIFMELQRGVVSDTEMDMYESWRRTFEPLIPLDLATARVYYLNPSLEVCQKRLAARNRAGELPAEVIAPAADIALAADIAPAADIALAADIAPAADIALADKPATGVSLEYQARLQRAHEALLWGKYGDEFPQLVARAPPYPRSSVVEIPESIANLNFRDPGPVQDQIISGIIAELGLE